MPLNRLSDSGQPIQPPPDVQRTSMSLDVLGRFVCSTFDEALNNGGPPFDVIIVGAGMFGGYCADKIARSTGKPLRVLILEAGPFLVPTHIQNLPRAGLNVPPPIYPSDDPGTPRDLVWGVPWRSNVEFVGQAYCVGGKSLYWGGWCPRLESDDLASWPPSVTQYLVQNYPLLERQVGVSDRTKFIQGPLFNLLKTRFSALALGAASNLTAVEDPPLAVQGQSPASGLFAFDKYSSVTLLIDAVREASGQSDNSRRIFLVPNSHVTKMEVVQGSVTGLHVTENGSARYIPMAPSTSVILAAGVIESTRLALQSSDAWSAGQSLIGRNLTSHVRSNMYFKVRRAALDPNGSLPALLQTGALLLRGSAPQGKFQIQVTASADEAGNSDALLYAMVPDVDQLDSLLAMQEAGWIAFALRGASELKGDKTTPVPNDQHSWINLSPFELDEFGMHRAYVHFSPTADDLTLATTMENCMLALANALANGNANDLQASGPQRDPLGSTYHESGTLWMGTDPTASVTDSNGRFHQIGNAYCADQALFVTVGSVNPTLTGLTLARKVSEAVIARANGQPAPP